MDERDKHQLKFIKSGKEVVSHLGFQIFLYFNVWLLPFWAGITIYSLTIKHYSLDNVFFGIAPVLVTFNLLLEGCRVYCGYYGNLFENLPALGAFFLITLFLQTPLLIVQLSSSKFQVGSLEQAFHIVILIFIAAELVTGYLALREISRMQAAKFMSSPEYAEYKNKKA